MDLPKLKQAVLEGTFTAFTQLWNHTALGRRFNMMLNHYWMEKRAASPNPLVKNGRKYFSQSDEDGITMEIMRRIGKLESGVFVEFGVGDGLENDTLVLLMTGWKGVWVGGEAIKFNLPPSNPKLCFLREWITAENCAELMAKGLKSIGAPAPDFLSVDIDGNDFYILTALMMSGCRPAVVAVEYNGKFPPPVRWTIKYDPKHRWADDDYHGASVQSYVDLLGDFGYRLVACNITGNNAFFVNRKFDKEFADVPNDVAKLFEAADYVWFYRGGHRTSAKTIERFL